jgi:hypothetical protein
MKKDKILEAKNSPSDKPAQALDARHASFRLKARSA